MRSQLPLFGLALLFLAAVGGGWPAHAQFVPTVQAIEPPAPKPGEIKLKAISPSPVKTGENWDRFGSGMIVRNVSQATLTPVLPAAGRANGTAVIVAPGGGFMFVGIEGEGYDIANFLASKGVTAFVLKYRLQPSPADGNVAMRELFGRLRQPIGVDSVVGDGVALATEDAQEAMRVVRANASKWGIDPKKVGFMGFSAGAFTTMNLVYKNDPAARPDFIAPIYGPTWTPPQAVPSSPPPMWVAIAANDDLLLNKSDLGLIQAWRAKGGAVEFHLYEKGGHGFGFAGAAGTTTVHWPQDFLDWLQSRGLYSPAAAK